MNYVKRLLMLPVLVLTHIVVSIYATVVLIVSILAGKSPKILTKITYKDI